VHGFWAVYGDLCALYHLENTILFFNSNG